MFTGIVEEVGEVLDIYPQKDNLCFLIKCSFLNELRVDQSLAHNGVCLTVVEIREEGYIVTAIEETLTKSNIGDIKVGDGVNLERSTKVGGRLDGHIVQGHVDTVAACVGIDERKGSWVFSFDIDSSPNQHGLLVEKGSITVNGVSLTCHDVAKDSFKVSIIPYTYEHTNMSKFNFGTKVNLEFDVIGKYVQQLMKG